MKSMITVLVILILKSVLTYGADVANYNVMVIDSSFAPIVSIKGSDTKDFDVCYWIDEGNRSIPLKGECYTQSIWTGFLSKNKKIIESYLSSLKGEQANKSQSWEHFLKTNNKLALKVKTELKLSTHGSRSTDLLARASEGAARILRVRNVSAQVGNVKSSSVSDSSSEKPFRPPYSKECRLSSWDQEDRKNFLQNGKLQPYQQRIKDALLKYPEVKVISISLGYKKSWIAEDNPKCTKEQVETEYAILKATWKSLISQMQDRAFVVAAGNEGYDFSNPTMKSDDLWADISDLSNLVVVGSIDRSGLRANFSNYGLDKMYWAKGRGVSINYPVPWTLQGFSTLANGTSSSAALFAGQIVQKLQKDKSASLKEVLRMLNQESAYKGPLTYEYLTKNCIDTNTASCQDLILRWVREAGAWGSIRKRYNQAIVDWHPAKPEIIFSDKQPSKAIGSVQLTKKGGLVVPAITIKPSSLEDMLLTLNHEIFHLATLPMHVGKMADTHKINNCMTEYQFYRFVDERGAFMDEIQFWESSPKRFKQQAQKIELDSELFSKKLSLNQYFDQLKAATSKDKNFILNKYIELGKAPKCALQLLKAPKKS